MGMSTKEVLVADFFWRICVHAFFHNLEMHMPGDVDVYEG
jgi:hypothetical protein